MQRFIHFIASSISVFMVVITATSPATAAVTPEVPLISEVQTGGLAISGQEDPKGEFIELYNPNPQAISLAGMQLEYLSSGHTGTGKPTRVLAALDGTIDAFHFYLISFPGYLEYADTAFVTPADNTAGLLARSGGHVRLVSGHSETIDMLSWGSAATISPYWKAPMIPAGMSVQRILPDEPDYSQGKEFRAPSPKTSPSSGQHVPPPETEDPEQPSPCQGIILTEILPNPSGTDTGKEFIEVYNPTADSIALGDCTLQVGTDEIFTMPDESLAAGAYRIFYDSETGLTLPNTTAQPVLLRTAAGTQQALYPNGLRENQSWIFISNSWIATVQPTPGAANTVQPEGGDAALPAGTTSADCGPGKERNPETNRCRTVPVIATTAACRSGYERNPSTNRCRSAGLESTSKLTPCKTGQERSPETNRCRAVASAASAAAAAKPCPSGQERNPDTNRCRKTAITGSPKDMATVHDVLSNPLTSNYRWWVAGFVVMAAAGYAVYEWRHDIYNRLAAFALRRSKPK